MNKFIILLLSFIVFSSNLATIAAPPPPKHGYHCDHCYHSYYEQPYIRYQTVTETEVPVYNCDKHFIEAQTIVTDYSDNTKTTSHRFTAYDDYNNIIANNCLQMEHIKRNNKCYFIIKFYEAEFLGSDSIKTAILCSDNNFKITNKYTKFEKIGENKYLVRKIGLYGIIDLDENEIVPIKYESLIKMDYGVYITSMNGAHGVISIDGKIILSCEYDKIKKLGNVYYQTKKDGKWGIISPSGKILAQTIYKDVKISKNKLYVKEFSGKWKELTTVINY